MPVTALISEGNSSPDFPPGICGLWMSQLLPFIPDGCELSSSTQ